MSPTKSTLATVAMVAALVLAGCAGAPGGGTTTPDGGAPATEPSGTDVGSDAGTVQFYISDERNAIGDFEHLNVTVTKVGLHRVGDAGGNASGSADASANETATETATATATVTATATPTPSGTPTPTPGAGERDDDEREDGEEREDGDGNEDDGEDATWVEYEVNRTVDLTELQGANATTLGVLAAPDGRYDKVFVYVSDINATLENGESVDVKLPSSKLHVNKGFTLGNGENVSFVFDISVHKAGNSGKYILKPVVGQSGTGEEVEIEDVDEEEDDEREDDEREDGGDDEAENETEDDEREVTSDLTAEFQGPVKAGKEAKLKVTGADGPVANATVEVNGESVGTTGPSGTITFTVPADAEEVEVTVRKGEAEAELEEELDGGQGEPSLWAVR